MNVSVNWTQVITIALLGGLGLGAMALGQVQIGVGLLGAAAGAANPAGLFSRPPNGTTAPKVLLALVAASLLFAASSASAQTVRRAEDTTTATLGANLAAVACTAAAGARQTGGINVSAQSNLVLDIDFVDADSSAADLQVQCQTSRTQLAFGAAGTRGLPVSVTTTAAGVTRVEDTHTWQFCTNPGTLCTAPGSFRTTLYIENIPAPWIVCQFTCGAGGAAADTITVFARGVNP